MTSDSFVAPCTIDESNEEYDESSDRLESRLSSKLRPVIVSSAQAQSQDDVPSEGALRGQSRRNQLLPWAWNRLSPADLEEVANALWDLPADATLLEKEAAFGLAAILTTGRRLSHLFSLQFLTQSPEIDMTMTEAVIEIRGNFYWNLIAGTAARQAARRPKKELRTDEYTRDKVSFVRFSLAPVARHCLARFPHLDSTAARPLFTHRYEDLKRAIETLLSTRRKDTAPPRRSSRTLECAERYLTAAISHQSGGDIGEAARMTDSDEAMSRTVMQYGVTRLRSTVWRAEEATTILNRDDRSEPIQGLDPGEVGNFRTPRWSEVKALIAACTELLENERNDDEGNHLAMTYYTIALLCYATAHRGIGEPLPLTNAVDRITGFCRLHEKSRRNSSEARLVWIAPIAIQQMTAFEDHVATLQAKMDPSDFNQISEMVRAGRLPLFSIVNRRAKMFTLSAAWKSINEKAKNLPRDFARNSGRHWLRSELTRYCSTETVHAFFGHKQVGTEPWALGACFDPLLYRADLVARLPGVLSRVGWRALDAKAQPR